MEEDLVKVLSQIDLGSNPGSSIYLLYIIGQETYLFEPQFTSLLCQMETAPITVASGGFFCPCCHCCV